jgi:hypothetical protein
MPITTPETERQFSMYGSALEVKAAAKASLALLDIALQHGKDLEGDLHAELLMAIGHMGRLYESAFEAVARLRPTKIEDRGYNAAERVGFRSGDGCGGCGSGSCGTCGSGGGCGGQAP